MFDLIKELTELVGPVGQEGLVLNHIEKLWSGLGARTERTRVGNVLARVGGAPSGKGKKLLIAAHGDELCYLVRAIDADGFLFLANGQGWTRTTDLRNAFTIGSRVKVLARGGVIPGVIASATGHIASFTMPDFKELTWNDFWVDTGLSRDELIARGVTPGTRIIWDGETVQWGHMVVGKALDDRVPLAVMTEMLRRVPKSDYAWDVTLACTVQEEIGTIGAARIKCICPRCQRGLRRRYHRRDWVSGRYPDGGRKGAAAGAGQGAGPHPQRFADSLRLRADEGDGGLRGGQ
ncbi:MAG: hypothetical protein HC853_09905 [Anaerolineae bacterium]|nr:hypothetical protein [Anaerolineae bacterium]